MHCFMMKALTAKNEWYTFTIADIPTPFSETEFALLGQPGSPRLQLKTIKRGDSETGLFDGDVILMAGEEWLVSYERGFYIINALYETKFLYEVTDFSVLGSCYTDRDFPIKPKLCIKNLFKFKDKVFRIVDIVGTHTGDSLILRCYGSPVLIGVDDVQQECGMSRNKTRLYLGDELDGGIVELYGGRICLFANGVYTDLTTGGIVDGCIS